MATLIPALGRCTARMTSGERRLGERLEQMQGGNPLPIHAVSRLRRATCPKTHYRNTRQILQTANALAGDLLTAQDTGDDAASEDCVPSIKPISCGRDGPEPIVIDLPTLPEQAGKIADLLQGAHADGLRSTSPRKRW